MKAAAAWSLGQVGRHSSDHAKALADANVLPRILAAYIAEESRLDNIVNVDPRRRNEIL